MVLPVDAVQTPATGVVNQLDGSCHVGLDRGRLVRKWGRLRRCCQGQANGKRQDQCAHFCLH
jgi:hypothetical protein